MFLFSQNKFVFNKIYYHFYITFFMMIIRMLIELECGKAAKTDIRIL